MSEEVAWKSFKLSYQFNFPVDDEKIYFHNFKSTRSHRLNTNGNYLKGQSDNFYFHYEPYIHFKETPAKTVTKQLKMNFNTKAKFIDEDVK